MPYSCRILLDSVNEVGCRLTTFELFYPRMVHAEFMTHRVFSRNAASSRAIPIEKFIERARLDPAMPVWWGKNQAGMQANEELEGYQKELAKKIWLETRDFNISQAERLSAIGLHKQVTNRLLEVWQYIGVIVTSTFYGNFFHLRDHRMAQPEIKHIAAIAHQQYKESKPRELKRGDWHLPLIHDEDRPLAQELVLEQPELGMWPQALTQKLNLSTDEMTEVLLLKVSSGRCARTSYLTHDGTRELSKDVELHDRLIAGPANNEPGHWSPLEHPACALSEARRVGNFKGFHQYRKMFPNEHFGESMP